MQIKIDDKWFDVTGIEYQGVNTPRDILRGKSIDNIKDVRMEQPQEKSRLKTLEEGLDNVCNQIDALRDKVGKIACQASNIDYMKLDIKDLYAMINDIIKALGIHRAPDNDDERLYTYSKSAVVEILQERVTNLEKANITSTDTSHIVAPKEVTKSIEMWISRDTDRTLYLSADKPYKDYDFWRAANMMELDYHLFTSVVFGNSPQKVELRLIKEDENQSK